MGKRIYLKPYKKQKRTSNIIILIVSMCLLVAVAFGVLYWVNKNDELTLTHKWKSEETGIVLTFTNEGKVVFNSDLPSGTYHIISPTTMEYTIEGKTFLMTYQIKDKKLYWGMDENTLESFKRCF